MFKDFKYFDMDFLRRLILKAAKFSFIAFIPSLLGTSLTSFPVLIFSAYLLMVYFLLRHRNGWIRNILPLIFTFWEYAMVTGFRMYGPPERCTIQTNWDAWSVYISVYTKGKPFQTFMSIPGRIAAFFADDRCRAAHCFSLRLQFCGKLKSPSCEEYLSQRAVFYGTLFSFVLDPGIR